MNISLIDVDSHNFPNLALMKISAYHKSKGDNVKFYDPLFDKPDLCYASKVFTFTLDYDYFPDCEIIEGGTGYNIKLKLPDEIDKMIPDFSLYDCEHAYGFLTRGCIRKCPWCIVPEKEGGIKSYADISDFIGNYKSVILMDNNILASKYGINQIEKIIKMGIKIDFNQGLDARLIDDKMAYLLSKIKWIRFIRMSCDTKNQFENVKKAILLLNKYGIKNYKIFVYMLIQNINESLPILNYFKKNKIIPFAQPYRDIKNNLPLVYEHRKFARWVNLKAAFNSTTWENYKECL